MKYQFGNENRKLSSDEIKSQMDFEQVAEGAKNVPKGRLRSKMLKSGISSAIILTISSVAFATTMVFVAPEIVEKIDKKEETKSIEQPLVEEAIPVEELPEQKAENQKPVTSTTAVPDKEEEEIIEKEIPDSNQLMESEDVHIEAYPIPSLQQFLTDINNDIRYPESGRKDSIEGYVRVFFKVNKEGVADEFKINKSLGEDFDKEAIRVLKLHNQWEPATYNGQAVDSYFTIKVSFEFDRSKKR